VGAEGVEPPTSGDLRISPSRVAHIESHVAGSPLARRWQAQLCGQLARWAVTKPWQGVGGQEDLPNDGQRKLPLTATSSPSVLVADSTTPPSDRIVRYIGHSLSRVAAEPPGTIVCDQSARFWVGLRTCASISISAPSTQRPVVPRTPSTARVVGHGSGRRAPANTPTAKCPGGWSSLTRKGQVLGAAMLVDSAMANNASSR